LCDGGAVGMTGDDNFIYIIPIFFNRIDYLRFDAKRRFIESVMDGASHTPIVIHEPNFKIVNPILRGAGAT
jgi:hypothetical protein